MGEVVAGRKILGVGKNLPQSLVIKAQALDPGCAGDLREPHVRTTSHPHHPILGSSWSLEYIALSSRHGSSRCCPHPFCQHALISAGVGETQDTGDTSIQVLCGTWEGVR